MMRVCTIYPVILGVTVSATVVALLFAPDLQAAAFNLSIQDGVDAARGRDQVVDLFGETGIFRSITNVLLFLVGAISVIMIIIGGLRYVVSGGESSAVGAAKNTILYAIVGLVVSMLAYAVIAFVIDSFAPGDSVSTI